MVDAATMIILRKPALRKDLHSPMGLRLQDPDSNVRGWTLGHGISFDLLPLRWWFAVRVMSGSVLLLRPHW